MTDSSLSRRDAVKLVGGMFVAAARVGSRLGIGEAIVACGVRHLRVGVTTAGVSGDFSRLPSSRQSYLSGLRVTGRALSLPTIVVAQTRRPSAVASPLLLG